VHEPHRDAVTGQVRCVPIACATLLQRSRDAFRRSATGSNGRDSCKGGSALTSGHVRILLASSDVDEWGVEPLYRFRDGERELPLVVTNPAGDPQAIEEFEDFTGITDAKVALFPRETPRC
jgi:hypothetical protein